MGEIGKGYGSEWHLLRYLGRHRAEFDRIVLGNVGGERVEWVDFEFDKQSSFGDREIRALGFLPAGHPARKAWSAFWPTKGNTLNWDLVGRLRRRGVDEWILVEAKANVEEIGSSCGADQQKDGYPKIVAALDATKRRLGVEISRDWLNGYYQYANRLAALSFLDSHGVSARLLFVYFVGDWSRTSLCPQEEAGWAGVLKAQDSHLGIPPSHPLTDRIHKLFLPVQRGELDPRSR